VRKNCLVNLKKNLEDELEFVEENFDGNEKVY